MRRDLESAKSDFDRERVNSKKDRLNEQMYLSQHKEESTDIGILKRKADRLAKENELLKKQNSELKTQIDSKSSRQSMYASGYHDAERITSGSKSLSIKKDASLSKDLQMKDMEVN